jgi:hypothetical protein
MSAALRAPRHGGIAFAKWDNGYWQIASDEPLTDETWPGWSDWNPMPRFSLRSWIWAASGSGVVEKQ